MKIEKSEIAGRLAKIKSIVPTNTTFEQLKGVLVDGDKIVAYNLETALSSKLDTPANEKFILPLKAIEMIENLPDGLIDISEQPKGRIAIQTGEIKNKFSTFPAEEFPAIPEITTPNQIGIEAEVFHDAVDSILYAASTDTNRPVTTGVLLECDGENLNIVGCDGFRLAWSRVKHGNKFKMVVPRGAIQKMLHLGLKGEIKILYNTRMAMFILDEYIFQTRLLEGNYVDYQKTFPNNRNSVIINRNSVIKSVSRAAICLDKAGIVVLDFDDDVLNVNIKSILGEYSEKVPLETKIDTPIRIGFNAKYLLECLRSYKSDQVECRFGAPKSPMEIDDGGLKSLLLPVRLKD